jgi:cytoskeleton protein RodZ
MTDRETSEGSVPVPDSREDAPSEASRSEDTRWAQPGRRLAELREQQGRSLAEISAALKLPRSVLEAIEQDRLDRIAPIYRRGYLVNYARELGEPADDYLNVDLDVLPPLTDVLPVARPPRTDRMLRFATYFLGTTLIVPPLVYFFISGGSRLFDGASEPAQEPAAIAGDAASDESSAVSRRIARALALDTGDTAAEPNEQGPLAASTLPLPALRPAASISSSEVRPSEPEPIVETPEQHRLGLQLLEDSWVEIFDATGQRLEFDLLRADTNPRYEGTPPFRILLGRASAVRISLDGRDVDFDGSSSGGVAEFTLALPTPEAPASGERAEPL